MVFFGFFSHFCFTSEINCVHHFFRMWFVGKFNSFYFMNPKVYICGFLVSTNCLLFYCSHHWAKTYCFIVISQVLSYQILQSCFIFAVWVIQLLSNLAMSMVFIFFIRSLAISILCLCAHVILCSSRVAEIQRGLSEILEICSHFLVFFILVICFCREMHWCLKSQN